MNSFIRLVPLFWAGYLWNGLFFWLHWVALAHLFFIYQERRRGKFLKDFLLPCWLTFLAVYGVTSSWILLHHQGVYFLGVFVFSLFFPLFFLAHYYLTRSISSIWLETIAAFLIFYLLELSASQIPALGSAGLDIFFQPPEAFLSVLKYFSFKIWSAWIIAICFSVSFFKKSKRVSFAICAILVLSFMVFFFLSRREAPAGARDSKKIKIALLQTNLPYEESWRESHFGEIKKKYLDMTLRAARGKPDLIVFPLYTLPGDVYRRPEFLQELAKTAQVPILTASHIPIESGTEMSDGFMNMAFLYNQEGKLLDHYQAVHALPFLDMPSKTSKSYRVIQSPFGKVGILLCYEDMIPSLARQAVKENARLLFAMTNPGLFQNTLVPYYELFQDQIRAAENRLPLVRVSTNGYSAWIDARGQIIKKTNLGTEEILYVELSASDYYAD